MNELNTHKKFTDLFIRRPVLATVVSLIILLVGFRSMTEMPLQQYPSMNSTMITVTTSYPGANSNVVQGYITSILTQAIASADGIDYMISTSQESTSTINVYVRLDEDPNAAMTNVMAAVASVQGQLPKQSQAPSIVEQSSDQTGLMYIGYTSSTMSPPQLYDYLSRAVQPVLQAQEGVASAQILGSASPAMRVWLNPEKMSALNVTTEQVISALQNNNYQASAGSLKGKLIQVNLDLQTITRTPEQFKKLVVAKANDGSQITIQDVSDKVDMGAQNYNTSVTFDGKNALFIGIFPTPSANPLQVVNKIRSALPSVEKNYPPGLQSKIVYDSTVYIRASIREVFKTIFEATIIVVVVIFLFLGSLRSVIIPVVTIPLSLVGVCSLMLALGFSINLLTLLAMVLAIGMVVDDAIVVVENIYRHVEEGKTPFEAALIGAREIASPVISMSLTLAAVFAPIGFMAGLTGALFKEFAFTLAASVIISGVIALTLSPMMCSLVLNKNLANNRFVHLIDTVFGKVRSGYERLLAFTLNYRAVTIAACVMVLLLCVAFLKTTPQDLAPTEDQGFVIVVANAPQYANLDYTQKYTNAFQGIYDKVSAMQDYFVINGFSFGALDITSAFSGVVLKPWDQRKENSQQIQMQLQSALQKIPGIQANAVQMPPLPGVSGYPVEFVITSLGDYNKLAAVALDVQNAALSSGMFAFMVPDLQYSQPDLEVHIDSQRAADLNIQMSDIANTFAGLYGENYINRFDRDNESYEVIPEVPRYYRYDADSLSKVYMRTPNNGLVPLSSFITFKWIVQPNGIYQYQQLNAVTLQGVVMPPHTLADGLQFLQNTLQKKYPTGYGVGYKGQSRQYIQEGNAMLFTFIFALIVIFLVLAAQFESFRDPLIVMFSVPLSLFGALLFLGLGFATLNIYTEIGLVTLIGLISKHGILMTEFANQLQIEKKMDKVEAIIQSAGVRLRPILMTTAAMIFGVLPLLLATGAGAHSRFDIGLVIASGMAIGTCFTLFVVPMVYSFVAKRHTEI